jgi:hypothetical protein
VRISATPSTAARINQKIQGPMVTPGTAAAADALAGLRTHRACMSQI